MPVAVSLPTRIRVDRRALIDRPDCIDAALAAALGRAIDNSRKIVLESRGRYLDVVALKPRFSWRGLPVDPQLRVAFERRVADLYDSLLAGRGIGDGRADAPEVIPHDPSEPFDPARAHRVSGVYVVDSYDGSVEPVSLTFEPLIVGEEEVVRVVQNVHDPNAITEFESISQGATPEQPLGLIYRVAQGSGNRRWEVLIATGPGRYDGVFGFDGFTKIAYAGPKANPMFKKEMLVPPPADGTAEIIDMPGDRAGLKAKYREFLKDAYAEMVRQAPKPVQLTTDRFREAVESGFDQFLDAELNRARKDITKAVLVRMSGAQTLLWAGPNNEPDLKWQGTAQLTPLIETRMRSKSEKKVGKGGATEVRDKTSGGRPGGTGPCPPDERPDDHPPDDVEGSIEDLPFLGEPSLEEIGDAGLTLGAKISALAKKLNIPECKYAGQFCYHVALQLLREAEYTQWMDETATGDNKPASGSKGNLGVLDFAPDKSPIIERIRELAAVVPELSDLIRWVEAIYESQTYRCSIHGIWRGQGSSWALRFLEAVVPVIKEAVGQMFVSACRSSLLQLLGTSLVEIEKRQKAMSRYAPLFERWIVPMIADMAELEIMRRILRNHKIDRVAKPIIVTAGVVTGQAWMAAGNGLVATLKGGFTRQAGMFYEIVQDGGVDKIRDRKGVLLWSSEDLENAIRLNGQIAEGADPLVKQIVDTPEAMQRFKDSSSIRDELEKLLKEMVKNNKEMREKVTNDAMFALKASRIDENIPTATVPGGKYSLQGIHKVAHDQIGDAFGKSGFYASGLDDLFDSEEGKAALKGAAIMTAFVVLCVLVPGGGFIAFVAGGALAAHELSAAYEKKSLYRSLINPDLVLTSAEVEVALFVAWFGVVMSAIPEAGTATKALIAGGRAIVRGEAKMLGKMATKAIATRVSKALAEHAVKDLLEAFVKETVTNIVMDQIIQQVMGPLISRIEHEASFGFGNAGSAVATEPQDDGGEQDFIDMILDFEESEILDLEAPEQ
jgi:hypothetical protein